MADDSLSSNGTTPELVIDVTDQEAAALLSEVVDETSAAVSNLARK